MGSEMGKHPARPEREERNRYNDPRPDDPAWRQAEDEMVVKLKETAKKNIEATKKEKDNTQNVRLWLNQITPDNYEKKQFELRSLMFGDRKTKEEAGFEAQDPNFEIDQEKQEIVVKTIFRKAQTEHAYANFYAKLCIQIVRLELQVKGLAPTRANGKQSDFRKNLLNNCKISFEQLLNAKETVEKKEAEKEEDRLEREFR